MTAGGALQGRVAVITGGGRGIGATIAMRFAVEGAHLILAARTQRELDAVAESCRNAGAECAAHVVDVSSHSAVIELIWRLPRIDVLVNAAGILGPVGPLTSNTLEAWDQTIRVNLFGTMYTCREALPRMLERRSGSIINFSGGGAVNPRPNFSAYAASKAAVVRLTETLAAEAGGTGVRINAIAPGLVDTRMLDGVLAAGKSAGTDFAEAKACRESPDGTNAAQTVAELALFLASDESKGLSGKLISAVHDPWRGWDTTRIESLSASGWYTLRRLDPFTLDRLKEKP